MEPHIRKARQELGDAQERDEPEYRVKRLQVTVSMV